MIKTITLSDILNQPRFSELTLLTRDESADVLIKNVEISETPDIANYTYSHSFILTTAMIYKEDQSGLMPLIDSLIEISATGLGIKVGRFIDFIDADIIEYANNNNFCLVQIPETLPLGGVLQHMNDYINHTKMEELNYALDIQKHFSNLILNDASLSKIISEFSQKVQCPVILINPFKEVVAFSNTYHQVKGRPEDIINSLIDKKVFSNHLKSTSSLFNLEKKNQIEIATYPIKNNNFFPYYLIIVDPKNIPYPISEFTIDQALLVLSFVLLKNDKVEESKKQNKSDHFANLIERQPYKSLKNDNWSEFDNNFGVQLSQFYQIVLVTIELKENDHIKMKLNEEKMKLTYQWLERKTPLFFKDAVVFSEKNSDNIVLLLQNDISQREIARALTDISEQLKDVLPIDLLFFCGQSCNSMDAVPTSLIEANILWKEAKKRRTNDVISFYKPKGILNLFDNVPNEEINYFAHNILKELATPSETIYIDLRKTLKTYLNNQCEITKTANDLFIHRNTVKYRIDNCEELLGIDLRDPENSLNIRLALELSES